jgi:hypothetical protein
MSAIQALSAARAFGIHLELDGDDLLLEASEPPPDAVLGALSRHKTEIIAMLRPGRDGWSADDWRLYFEERAAVAEFDGGLPRAGAEAQAFECCIVAWLNRNPAPSVAGRCAWCGHAGSHNTVVLPFGTEPGTHTWLHPECWPEWRNVRRNQALETLTRNGIGCLSERP